MEREDYRLVPLALVGLAIGIGEVIIRPFLEDQAEHIKHVAKAAISYYQTPEA